MGVAVLFAWYGHTDSVGKLSFCPANKKTLIGSEKITYLHFEFFFISFQQLVSI